MNSDPVTADVLGADAPEPIDRRRRGTQSTVISNIGCNAYPKVEFGSGDHIAVAVTNTQDFVKWP